MIALLILAVALAMDAFAVSLAQGAAGRMRVGQAMTMALIFGAAQGLMPLFGWALGAAFGSWFERIDHWIAFAILSLLGLNMIRESGRDMRPAPALSGWPLFAAAIATSIDAAAAGITLPLLELPVGWACAAIGAVTAALCFIGALAGDRVGRRLGRRAGLFGGVVLIGLGAKILVEHLAA